MKILQVLKALRDASEGNPINGWRAVYLDNAKASEECTDMTRTAFRSYLAKLSQRGLYKVIDGYAWGDVKMTDTE